MYIIHLRHKTRFIENFSTGWCFKKYIYIRSFDWYIFISWGWRQRSPREFRLQFFSQFELVWVSSKMAASIDGVLHESLQNAVKKSKVLIVGAGGIGCEILKNLVMTGFSDIEIVSLISAIHAFPNCRSWHNLQSTNAIFSMQNVMRFIARSEQCFYGQKFWR